MATILLSIKPEYVERIFDGSKKFEFRKHLPQRKVDRIIVYSTDPMQRVVGEVAVLGTLAMKLSPLWEATKTSAGISRAKYRAYFKGCTTAYAFQLGQTHVYDKPKTLEEMGIDSAPQSFISLSED